MDCDFRSVQHSMAGKFLYKNLYGWTSMKVLLENNKFLGSAARVGLVEEFLSQDRGVSDSSLIVVAVLSP